MASMAAPPPTTITCRRRLAGASRRRSSSSRASLPRIALSLDQDDEPTPQPVPRREIILRSSELAVVGAIFQLGGKKPEYLGVQKSTPALALCPATKNCVSTSENIADPNHYAPPWSYNPEGGRGRKNPVSREVAKEELIEVIKSLKPDKFTPRIVENKDDYLRVEYESPILGFVDDVEFWFPPGKDSIVEYRSASRMGNFDFDINRKRIKALRLELEKKGWASQDSF